MSYRKQELNIPAEWTIRRHEFYDIDPFDNSTADEKSTLIFVQENMLWVKKGNYNIDLGWYGGDDLENDGTGFYIFLFRGDNWNKCDLLEKFRTKNKKDVVDKLQLLFKSIDNGDYDNIAGYKIDAGDSINYNSMTDFETYTSKK